IQNRGTLLRAGILAGLVIAVAAILGQLLFEMPSLKKAYQRHEDALKVRSLLDDQLSKSSSKDEAQNAKMVTERSKAVKAMWREYVDFFGHSFWGFINCAFSGFFLYEILRWIERFFGVVTRLHLVQLADLNEPLLRRLNMETPGTYHHCQMVAQLAEAAAEDIGADSLLVRVGAYYHDIGKMAKPHYFTENNPFSSKKHGRLTPTLSTLIIHAHVKDGIELARSLNLPQKIIDFIPEHHGTTACEFFYRQAVDHAKENDLPIPDKDMFRYPGPKPRTKETAIILVSDSVEAATRSLKNPSPGRIRSLVHEIIIDKLLDHQFDESPITLGELGTVEDTLVRKLTWMHHARIRYPEKVQTAQQAKLKALDRERHGGLEKDPKEIQGPQQAQASLPAPKEIEPSEKPKEQEQAVPVDEKASGNEKKPASNTEESDASAAS
ncbi:MAG: HDIG domain-containing protein, partial [Planctomycetota bacterium]|nr:HDIG domain-containing protein [Planctomycetota bacterium]